MKKFLIGLVTGLLLAALSVVVLVFSLARFGERRPAIANDSTLILRLNGSLPERAQLELPFPFGGTPQMTMHDTWSMLRKAAADRRIKALVLIPEDLDAGWAKLQELREGLMHFKKSGKPLVVFLQSPNMREYYVATAADRIYAAPEEFLDVKGLRAEMVYMRGTLNKLGVEPEFQHIGRYKDAGDTFTETQMSPETREVMNSVLDSIYGHLLSTIAAGRKRTPEQIASVIDGGPYTATQAQARGLIDALRYEDQIYGELAARLKQKQIVKVSQKDYMRVPASGLGIEGDKQIALVSADGAISRGTGEGDMGSSDGLTSGSFIRMVRKVAADSNIRGVILRIDSPGGDGIASDEMLREVQLLAKKKPTVFSMSDAAASGGYYIAMTGDPIVAYPNTFTGSIGVFYGKINLRKLYDNVGIQKELLLRGRNADIDSDYKPLSPEGQAKLRESLEEFYRGFVKKVAEGRRRPYEQVEPLAQGRVWLGSQAKANGLVDELGGLDRAIELLKAKAKISAGEKIKLVPYPPKRNWLEQLMEVSGERSAETRLLSRVLPSGEFRVLLRGGVMKMRSYEVRVQ